MIQVGSMVEFTDAFLNDCFPQFYPPPGTVGRVVALREKTSDSYWVQWPEGATSGDDKWLIRESSVRVIEEEG